MGIVGYYITYIICFTKAHERPESLETPSDWVKHFVNEKHGLLGLVMFQNQIVSQAT